MCTCHLAGYVRLEDSHPHHGTPPASLPAERTPPAPLLGGPDPGGGEGCLSPHHIWDQSKEPKRDRGTEVRVPSSIPLSPRNSQSFLHETLQFGVPDHSRVRPHVGLRVRHLPHAIGPHPGGFGQILPAKWRGTGGNVRLVGAKFIELDTRKRNWRLSSRWCTDTCSGLRLSWQSGRQRRR